MDFKKENSIFHMRWISFEDFNIMIFYMMFWCYTFFSNRKHSPLPHSWTPRVDLTETDSSSYLEPRVGPSTRWTLPRQSYPVNSSSFWSSRFVKVSWVSPVLHSLVFRGVSGWGSVYLLCRNAMSRLLTRGALVTSAVPRGPCP